MIKEDHYILCCHSCGEVISLDHIDKNKALRCFRCHTLLQKNNRATLTLSCIFALTSLILFYPALAFPLLKISIHSFGNQINIFNTIQNLFIEKHSFIGFVVAITTCIAPLLYLISLASFRFIKKSNRFTRTVLKMTAYIQDWHMIDVFLIAILVSIVKLLGDFRLEIGQGFYFTILLTFSISLSSHFFDIKQVWERLQ